MDRVMMEVTRSMMGAEIKKGGVLDTIYSFDATERLGDDAFGTLREVAQGFATSTAFFDHLLPFEKEYVKEKFAGFDIGDRMNAVTMLKEEAEKAGFKYSPLKSGKVRVHILPAKYKTAKSVLGRALDADIILEGRGKTDLEKELNVKSTPTLSPFEVCMKHAKGIAQHYENLSTDEFRTILDTMTNKGMKDGSV